MNDSVIQRSAQNTADIRELQKRLATLETAAAQIAQYFDKDYEHVREAVKKIIQQAIDTANKETKGKLE